MKSVLILKRSSFGDIVHTLPVVTALRNAFPEIRISWLTDLPYERFLGAVDGIDRVLGIGFRRMFRLGRLKEYFGRIGWLRRGGFDALLDFQGTIKSWLLILRTRAARKIGFDRADAREPLVCRFYSETMPPLDRPMHVIERNLRLLSLLGVENAGLQFPRIRPDQRTEEEINTWLAGKGYDDDGPIVVNPFTAWESKTWLPGHAAALCLLIHKSRKRRPIVLWGNRRERAVASRIVAEAQESAVLAPPTDLPALVPLLGRSAAYVGGDTGPTQLAAALSVPLVALFGPTDPSRNGPFDPADAVVTAGLQCEPCWQGRCSLPAGRDCMSAITPEEVYRALLGRLRAAGRA